MSTESTPLLPFTTVIDSDIVAVDIAKNWGWILAAGIINFIAGVFALMCPLTATKFILMLISVSLLIGGIATTTGLCFAEPGLKALCFVGGILQVMLAIILQTYPFETFMVITIMIAILFMLDGVLRCAVALQNRDYPTWGWTLINGLANIVLSIVIISAFPTSSLYTLGILVGVNLVVLGMGRVAVATVGRSKALDYIAARIDA